VQNDLIETLYSEICVGHSFSTIILEDSKLEYYYRHPCHREVFELDRLTNDVIREAVDSGLFTFDEALAFIINEGWWTPEQEAELEQNNNMLKRLMDTRKLLTINRDKEEIDKQISPVQKRMAELLLLRSEFMPQTAESFANKITYSSHIIKFLFKDELCQHQLFDEDEFYLLDDKTTYALQSNYADLIETFGYNNIEKLASSVMFQNFLYVGGDTTNDFFGSPVTKVTRYQFELFSSGQNYKNIIKNCSVMEKPLPEYMYGNPFEINNYYQMINQAWEMKNKIGRGNDARGSSMVGATPEENKVIHGKQGSGGLLSAAKKHGGKLDMNSMMNM